VRSNLAQTRVLQPPNVLEKNQGPFQRKYVWPEPCCKHISVVPVQFLRNLEIRKNATESLLAERQPPANCQCVAISSECVPPNQVRRKISASVAATICPHGRSNAGIHPVQDRSRQSSIDSVDVWDSNLILQQNLRVPFFIMQFLPFGSSNLSLDTVLVKVAEQLLRAFAQVKTMKTVRNASSESSLATRLTPDWPDLDVFRFICVHVSLHMQQQIIQFGRVVHQRFDMI
jgi:hypothetical protein